MEVVNSEIVEVDPTGRYGRYNEVLGKGASKIVYRAFDEYEGIEVAWNQVRLSEYLHSSEDLKRLCSEIHLLKTLNHDNIMKFYNSWVDTRKMNINFITEMFTSGTLRQYRQKHKRVHIRAIKDWCRQILRGLDYLHSLNPPVIHRDLKCDNIFINGNQGEVKIGDLGLAAILRKTYVAHCVGTPEFMAPEVYQEEYNELVDIYAFGMCILEMITFEYPYSECAHPVQIYKKVMNGKKPDALYKVKDPEVRRFIGKCLATVSSRQSARELLKDPFLQEDDCGASLKSLEYLRTLLPRQPLFPFQNNNSFINGYDNGNQNVGLRIETNGMELFMCNEDEHLKNMDITITGKRSRDGEILLTIKITDKEGVTRKICFPFDLENDTALSVATEMVMELELTDYDVTTISEMIDGEIACLVPEWQTGTGIEEVNHDTSAKFCRNCASNRTSNGSLIDYACLNNPGAKSLRVLPCLKQGCASMYDRFGEITYQDKPEHSEGAPDISGHSDGIHHTHILDHNEEHELTFERKEALSDNNECVVDKNVIVSSYGSKSYGNSLELDSSPITPLTCAAEDDYENEIRQELRWIKASYQMQMMNLKNGLSGGHSRAPSWSPDSNNAKHKTETPIPNSPVSVQLYDEDDKLHQKSFLSENHYSCGFAPIQNSCPDLETQRDQHCEASTKSISPEHMYTARNFYAAPIGPSSMHRSTSLLVDAVDV